MLLVFAIGPLIGYLVAISFRWVFAIKLVVFHHQYFCFLIRRWRKFGASCMKLGLTDSQAWSSVRDILTWVLVSPVDHCLPPLGACAQLLRITPSLHKVRDCDPMLSL